jgi:uncharacterized membrane protein
VTSLDDQDTAGDLGVRRRWRLERAERRTERWESRRERLDVPVERRRRLGRPRYDPDAFGRVSEQIARFLGTGRFIVYMTVFVAVWLTWNTVAPPAAQFDPRATNYTLLTLILSLQASYAAPLILLAQNRQDDRDRVNQEQDRAQTARTREDLEFLTREIASLRIALGEVATRDFVRGELSRLLEEREPDPSRRTEQRD